MDRDAIEDARLRAKLGTRGFQVNDTGRCGCAECGHLFSGLTAFDKHRPPAASDDPCRDPATVGLEPDTWGVWRSARGER